MSQPAIFGGRRGVADVALAVGGVSGVDEERKTQEPQEAVAASNPNPHPEERPEGRVSKDGHEAR